MSASGDDQQDLEARLREATEGLAVDDVLALCYSSHLRTDLSRLRLYLDLLRKRGGERAQFASCLVCFDLARQGDANAQREFGYLADTIRGLTAREDLVTTLIGGDPYLLYVWELLLGQLEEMDPRFVEDVEVTAVPTLELISDADITADELSLEVDDGAMWLRFDGAVEDFLGGEIGVPVYDPTAGFRLRNSRDIERIEKFLQELDSVRGFVPLARGFRALALLFYGTHLRSRSLFGAVNERKQGLLRAGIGEWLVSANEMAAIAGVLGPIHAEEGVWEKVSDVLADYVAWVYTAKEAAQHGPMTYDAVGRMVERYKARGLFR